MWAGLQATWVGEQAGAGVSRSGSRQMIGSKSMAGVEASMGGSKHGRSKSDLGKLEDVLLAVYDLEAPPG